MSQNTTERQGRNQVLHLLLIWFVNYAEPVCWALL